MTNRGTAILAQRALGQFPISIATSLAFEGLVGIHPDLPKPTTKPVSKYETIYINVDTILRNMLNSISTSDIPYVLPEDALEYLKSELLIISNVVADQSGGKLKVHYYVVCPTLFKAKFKSKHITFKTPTTPNQVILAATKRIVMQHLMKESIGEISTVKVTHAPMPNSLMLSHKPTDLIMFSESNNIQLLESHTGKIKSKAFWNTKLKASDDVTRIPFCKFSLCVFGDSGDDIKPLSSKIRAMVTTIADQKKWTITTPIASIKKDLATIPDPNVKDVLLSFF